MTVSKDYEKYLTHFRETVTMNEFHSNSLVPGLCALRHDVDHDLDLALEMAHFEHVRGFRSTYFILPGTPYWRKDSRLIDKCLQLQDYGHEVGLHVNVLAEWASGETNDVTVELEGQLALLRSGGVNVYGIAAHGDKRCYQHQLSNYWCFEELRPVLPYESENGRTAEGPYEIDGRPRLIYPQDHNAKRPDGSTLNLWSVNMRGLNLRYHAWHTAFDQYFSDSTGGWKRTLDPLTVERNHARWQVLIHPEHWRGPKKYYFFLSSARSGSKWLSELLEAATPLKTRHEYILNQPFHHGKTTRKGTSDVWFLEDDAEEVRARLAEAWEEFHEQSADFAEVNVYLENFTDQLKTTFPEATFIHLKRDPRLVVSSLMDRNWYDTPEDRRHPRLVGVDPIKLTQFERVCHYVSQVEHRLSTFCNMTVELADLTTSPNMLSHKLQDIGVVFHPRLGAAQLARVINATVTKHFPVPAKWDIQTKNIFNLCMRNRRFMHASGKSSATSQIKKLSLTLTKWLLQLFNRHSSKQFRLTSRSLARFGTKHCEVEYQERLDQYIVTTGPSTRHGYLSIGGGDWYKIKLCQGKQSGWVVLSNYYVKGSVVVSLPESSSLTVYVIFYSEDGNAINRRSIGSVDSMHNKVEFSLSFHPLAKWMDFIIYASGPVKPQKYRIVEFLMEYVNHG